MSVVSSLCFVIAETSQAICAAMALKTISEKTGDVKERAKRPESLSRGDVHWRGLGRRRVAVLACARFNVVPIRTDRIGPRGAVRPTRIVRV